MGWPRSGVLVSCCTVCLGANEGVQGERMGRAAGKGDGTGRQQGGAGVMGRSGQVIAKWRRWSGQGQEGRS